MKAEIGDRTHEVLALASQHGLTLQNPVAWNEQGLDFRIAFAKDTGGLDWVLRLPRRGDVQEKMIYEAKVLAFVKKILSVKVPDWQIASHDLIAYPRLLDPTALEFDAATYAVTWHIDQHAPLYVKTLADTLVELHGANVADAKNAGIRAFTPREIRAKFLSDLELVKKDLGLSADLEDHCRSWLIDDKSWPNFSTLIHGDLYAGHITADKDSRVSGIIDWTEAEISDPSIDFTGHLAAFDAESLSQLIDAYANAGGRTWPTLLEHVKARHIASPIRYGIFALTSQKEDYKEAAKKQLLAPLAGP